MGIEAVIFDIGEVLVMTKETGMDDKWEQRLGLPVGYLNRRLLEARIPEKAVIGELSEEDLQDAYQQVFGLDTEAVQEFISDLWNQFELNEELAWFLASLRPSYKTATLSNAWADARKGNNDRFKLNELVDLLVYSAEEGIAKPDLRIYRRACERLEVPPEKTLYLDDVPAYVKAAQVAGMQAIQFQDNPQAIRDIQTYLTSLRTD